MRRLSWRRAPMLAAAALAVATLVGGAAPARAAVPVTQVGWWTRSPSPPTVPDGGIAVGVAPDGNVTVSAIQLDVGGGASQAKVAIKEAAGQAGGAAASLQVCSTTDEWSSAKGDPLEQAPRPTCSAQPVLLTRGDDGTWTADVTSLVASAPDGKASIMIVPAPSPAPVPGVQPAAYQLSFDAPAVDGTTLPASESASESSSSSSSSFSGSTATDSSSLSTPSYAVEPPPSPAPASNAAPTAIGPVPPPASSADSSANRGGGSSSLPAAALAARAGGNGGPSGAAALGIVLLSLLVGGMAATGRWAMQSGVLDRVTPGGGGGMLRPPD